MTEETAVEGIYGAQQQGVSLAGAAVLRIVEPARVPEANLDQGFPIETDAEPEMLVSRRLADLDRLRESELR